jgi:hypothetical protein
MRFRHPAVRQPAPSGRIIDDHRVASIGSAASIATRGSPLDGTPHSSHSLSAVSGTRRRTDSGPVAMIILVGSTPVRIPNPRSWWCSNKAQQPRLRRLVLSEVFEMLFGDHNHQFLNRSALSCG